MNKEPSTFTSDIIWQQYQFAFSEIIAPDDNSFSDLVREKLDSLGLNNEHAEIRFEEVEGQPELYNIYVQQRVEQDPVRTPSQTSTKPLFERGQERALVQGKLAQPLELQPQVETVSFKGAIRNPPQSADPLP